VRNVGDSPEAHHTNERGAALLTVLLLVAVMSVVAAASLEKLTVATRLSANAASMDQARAYVTAASLLAEARLAQLVKAQPGRVSLKGGWLGKPQTLPVPEGTASITPQDGGNCFNLNSLVSGSSEQATAVRPIAVEQFTTLMQLLGVPSGKARGIAASASDWIDSDSTPQTGGAEDEVYLAAAAPYRAPNRLMFDKSELRAVAGVTPAIYNLLDPWICALPVTDLSPLNVNTLLPAQAPLFAMLMGGKLSLDQARSMLAARPEDGYGSTYSFWAVPALKAVTPPAEVEQQVRVTTRWFGAKLDVDLGAIHLRRWALYDAQSEKVKLVRMTAGGSL